MKRFLIWGIKWTCLSLCGFALCGNMAYVAVSANSLASLIDVNKKEMWENELKSLRIGKSIAVGCFRVRGKTISHPIIIKSDFKTVEN